MLSINLKGSTYESEPLDISVILISRLFLKRNLERVTKIQMYAATTTKKRKTQTILVFLHRSNR